MRNSAASDESTRRRSIRLRVLFFCGERSRWGYSHLQPLLSDSRLELAGVVLATDERWAIFREALKGEKQDPYKWRAKARRAAKALMGRTTINRTRSTLRLLRKHNIPVLFSDDANSPESVESYNQFSADLSLCAAFPQIFKSQVLSIPPKGAFNSHPSLLPKCRGAHPVFWAIASGETVSGATVHSMTRELDQGGIVAQIAVDIRQEDTYSQLYTKLVNQIPDLVSEFGAFCVTPQRRPIPQDDSNATYFRNDRLIHRRVFWSEMTATQICNLVRACDGSAYCWNGERKIRLLKAKKTDSNRNMTNSVSVPPGTIVDIRNNVPVVAARSEFVSLESLALPRLRKVNFEIGQVLH